MYVIAAYIKNHDLQCWYQQLTVDINNLRELLISTDQFKLLISTNELLISIFLYRQIARIVDIEKLFSDISNSFPDILKSYELLNQ